MTNAIYRWPDDSARLARKYGQPIRRARRVRRERNRRATLRSPPSLRERLDARIVARWEPVIEAAGFPAAIQERHGEQRLQVAGRGPGGCCLLRAEGHRYYSPQVGSWPATISYICGTDDGQPWVERVSAAARTVPQALEEITPREVRGARGRLDAMILRQGDVWLVGRECERPAAAESQIATLTDDLAGTGTERHSMRPHRRLGGIVVEHPEHEEVYLPCGYTWRAYQTGSRRVRGGCGD